MFTSRVKDHNIPFADWAKIFMIPRQCILMTFVISWLFQSATMSVTFVVLKQLFPDWCPYAEKEVKRWIKNVFAIGYEKFDWSAQNPDLSSVQHLWDELSRPVNQPASLMSRSKSVQPCIKICGSIYSWVETKHITVRSMILKWHVWQYGIIKLKVLQEPQ